MLVWIGSGGAGEVDPRYLPVLDRKQMIWAQAVHDGDEIGSTGIRTTVNLWYQMGLAIDAVHNLSKQYKIDKNRVYVAGFGDGAVAAGRLAFGVADIFQGSYLMGRIEFYDNIYLDNVRGTRYYRPADYSPPRRESLRLAKSRSRFVFQVDAHDKGMGESHTRDLIDLALKPRKFRYVEEVAGADGDAPPDAGTLEKAIDLLDAPLK